MNNYNSSSYYRANPYKDIGYMPPIAQRNRSNPGHSHVPQGLQYFEPSAKKHYEMSYQNEIQNDNILRAAGQMSPIEKQALQRSYFRSLNSQDIEGSSTNTLISKAVKNKMKAQQELQRRKQIQREAAEAQRQYQYQQEMNRKKYLESYHRQVMEEKAQKQKQNSFKKLQPTNNQQIIRDQRKKRESQLLRLAQQRKNYAIVDFPSLQSNRPQLSNSSAIVESKPNFHMRQVQKRKKTQTSYDPSYGKNQQDPYTQNHYANRLNDKKQNLKEYSDSLQRNTNNGSNGSNGYYNNQNHYEQMEVNRDGAPGTAEGMRNRQTFHQIQKDQIRKYEDYSLPYDNIGPITQIPKKQESYKNVIKQNVTYSDEGTRNIQQNYRNNLADSKASERIQQNYYKNSAYGEPMPLYQPQPFKTRQDLRRHNPTFLSYGSPTFALASRNVIGN